jgi:hypothetical protein
MREASSHYKNKTSAFLELSKFANCVAYTFESRTTARIRGGHLYSAMMDFNLNPQDMRLFL